MIAPSEKHLEDWIVANPNRVRYFDGQNWVRPFHHLMGRQIKTMSGVIDLVVWGDSLVCPIEIKREKLTAHHLVQLLSYMGDIDCYMRLIAYQEDKEIPRIKGILIGHSFADRRLLCACMGANVEVLTYQYQSGEYLFQRVHAGVTDYERRSAKGLVDLIETWPGPEVQQ